MVFEVFDFETFLISERFLFLNKYISLENITRVMIPTQVFTLLL